MIINELKEIESVIDIHRIVKKIYEDIDDIYVPAIINQGIFTLEDGEDFYLKLVLAHNKLKLSKTWLKGNLSMGIRDPDIEEFDSIYELLTENVITRRQVKGSFLYQLNPNLVTEEIDEYEYDNNVIVNAFFNKEYSSIKGKPVLIQKNDKDIYVNRNVFDNYLNDPESNIYPKYKLVAEIEYRTHGALEGVSSDIYKFENSIFDVSINKEIMYIIGSIDMGILPLKEKEKGRNIKVISLDTGKVRDHNPKNFNDDLEAGFILFKKEVLDIIKKDYYIYDLVIYDKNNINNKYIIDILDEKVVFWEGEYNKLPIDVKERIDIFNYGSDNETEIISQAMNAWQLQVDWNFHLQMQPEQQLALVIRTKYFNKAIENNLYFIVPKNLKEFKNFIYKLERVTEIPLTMLNQDYDDVKKLTKILNGELENMNYEEMKRLYRKYCFHISRMIDNEYFR